jgi:putative transposase
VAQAIWETLSYHHHQGKWRIDAVVVMPDHVHVLAEVPVATDLRRTFTDWKRFVARHHGVRWQRDFFEHRLRATESVPEKREYLRHNPRSAGLVEDSSAWPWFWSGACPSLRR